MKYGITTISVGNGSSTADHKLIWLKAKYLRDRSVRNEVKTYLKLQTDQESLSPYSNHSEIAGRKVPTAAACPTVSYFTLITVRLRLLVFVVAARWRP